MAITTTAAKSAAAQCLPLAELPHTSALFRNFAVDFAKVAEFFAHPPDTNGVNAAAREVHLANETRSAVAAVLREQNASFGSSAEATQNIERLANGAVAVVTGQQVGLFGGPAFSFYKALTAIREAARLTKSGTDAVPVFWLATEDHDLAEINEAYLLGSHEFRRVALFQREQAARVGHVKLGETVAEAVEHAGDLLTGPASDAVIRALRESYTAEETFGSAFGKLMARVLAGRGMILLDPLDARLHRLAAPVYQRALAERVELTRELLARGKSLEKRKYHQQVKIAERNTLLFVDVDGRREPIRERNGKLVAGAAQFSSDELQKLLHAQPERFSGNALLRPVVQDALLPTAAYVAGPAEVAYLAQSSVIYQRLLGRMPCVLPRAGFTLVEPHLARLLKKYGLDVRQMFAGSQRVRKKMELQFVPAGLAKRFDTGEKEIRTALDRLQSPLRKLDRTLEGALITAEEKMMYQYNKLRGKAGRARSTRDDVLARHLNAMCDALYPQSGLQERTLSLLPFVARHGMELLDELESKADGRQHHVLYL